MNTEVSNAENHDLAAEYVLGTLRGEARDRFERRLAEDGALRREVAAWERRLEPLMEAVEPSTPPDRVWRAIEARIAPRATQPTGFWNNLNFWRGLSLVTASLVLGLSLTLFGLLQGPGQLDGLLVVTNDQSRTGWIVNTRRHEPMLNVSAVQPSALPSGKVCQLWLETADGVMLPLGILPHEGSMQMPLPMTPGKHDRFKVTIESDREAPVRQPSGEVVFEGELISI